MEKSIHFLTLLMAVFLLVGTTSCKQDEATINGNIVGSWTVDDSQTLYNGGLLLNLYGANTTDSLGALITPVFEGCSMKFTADQSGTITLPALLNLTLADTYAVSTGAVTLTFPNLSGKSIKFNISSITSTEMKVSMAVSDVNILVSAVDTVSNAENANLMELLKSAVPAIADVESKLEGIDLSALGLNPMPTITLVFKKSE